MIKETAALAIFALVYVIILAGENSPRKLDRPAAGLIGGVLTIICGVLTKQEAIAAVDFSTLSLLFGMMTLVHYATESGMLEAFAEKLVEKSHTPIQMLWIVCFASGFLSALFVNDTLCLLMTPLLLSMTRRLKIGAEPFLICLATSSNVGSVITITGNPQNMLIGQTSGLTWPQFALYMLPVGLLCLVINGFIVQFVYRKELQVAFNPSTETQERIPIDRRLAIKTSVVLFALLVSLLSGVQTDIAALIAAITILMLANRPPAATFQSVDWALLLFFAGLFIVVDGVTKTQAHLMAQLIPYFTSNASTGSGLSVFSLGSVIGSNLFGNVPFVMLLRNSLLHVADAKLLWLTLAMSSTFAGNLTLVGSVANLIVAQGSQNECPLSFVTFLKVGVPTTIATVVLGTATLFAYHAFGWL